MKPQNSIPSRRFFPGPQISQTHSYVAAKSICKKLQGLGFECFLVGGSVRDMIGIPGCIPLDFDIATSATPEAVKETFPFVQFVGNSFGVSIVPESGFYFEVSTFRKDGKYSDRRRPDSIEFGNFQEDSCRRDFTINALYFDPLACVLFDPHSGLVDLENKRIRCVGDANQRFYEDPLRILRLYRFAAYFNFEIEACTLLAAQRHQKELVFLSKERVFQEFCKVKNGIFETFFKRIFSDISFLSLFPKAVFEQSASKIEISGADYKVSSTLHESFPGTSTLLNAVLFVSNENPFLKSLSAELAGWPISVADRAFIKAAEKIIGFCYLKETESAHFLSVRFVSVIQREIQRPFTPILDILRVAAFVSVNNNTSVHVFLNAMFKNAQNYFVQKMDKKGNVADWWKHLVPRTALPFSSQQIQNYLEFNLFHKSYFGAVTMIQEVFVLVKVLGLNQKYCGDFTTVPRLEEFFDFASKMNREKIEK